MKEKILEYIKENKIEVAIISAITLLALILRLIVLYNYGDLWLDELYSWYFAKQKFIIGTLWKLLTQDLHMPLYFVILHFWTKIFGQSDASMHLCTIFVSLPLIPLSYYLMKNLFNKTTGYFSAILFTINTFCIYYSVEVRFYGLVFVLALVSAFYFVKMLENLDKKYVLGFIISHSLLMYTFSATPLLTFFYGIVGGVYLLNKKRDLLLEYCKKFLIVIGIAIPVVIFNICNIVIMHSNFCSFQKDIYAFNWNVISDILENYFTSQNFQIFTGALNVYFNIFTQMQNNIYLIFVFIPIFIGLGGILKALLEKNDKLYLFLFPSLMFLLSTLLLASVGAMSLLTKYTSIIFPVIICTACYGLSKFNLKILSYITFTIFILLNISFLQFQPMNVYNLHRKELGEMPKVMNEIIKPKKDDLFIIPYSGNKVMRYIPQGNILHFYMDDALLLKDKQSLAQYFDKQFLQYLNRNNVTDYMYEDLAQNKPFILYHIMFQDDILPKLKKGQRLIIISYRNGFTESIIEGWSKNKPLNTPFNMFSFLMAKVLKDTLQLSYKYLTFENMYTDENNLYTIFVYKKK